MAKDPQGIDPNDWKARSAQLEKALERAINELVKMKRKPFMTPAARLNLSRVITSLREDLAPF